MPKPESYFLSFNAATVLEQTWILDQTIIRQIMTLLQTQDEMKECVISLKVKIELLLPSSQREDVIKLIYQYKHLNLMNLSNLFETDFIIHRVCFVSETKPHFVDQKRWPLYKK